MTTAPVTCPLCEATCGLSVTLEDGRVTGVRGDDADVFSRGYICPKGASLGALHHDPDRLRRPLVRRGGGVGGGGRGGGVAGDGRGGPPPVARPGGGGGAG